MKKETQGLADAGDKMWDLTESFEFEMQLTGAGETQAGLEQGSWIGEQIAFYCQLNMKVGGVKWMEILYQSAGHHQTIL